LLDGDNRNLADREILAEGLEIARWDRYEAESYLVHPEVLSRFLESQAGSPAAAEALRYLTDQLPPAVYRDPLAPHDFWRSIPASKTLLPGLFKQTGVTIGKAEYYLIAEQMRPEEIPEEVKEKLDRLVSAFRLGK
jgi:hypothetical protein